MESELHQSLVRIVGIKGRIRLLNQNQKHPHNAGSSHGNDLKLDVVVALISAMESELHQSLVRIVGIKGRIRLLNQNQKHPHNAGSSHGNDLKLDVVVAQCLAR